MHRGSDALLRFISENERVHSKHTLTTQGVANALFTIHTSLLDKHDHVVVMHPNYGTNIETLRAIQYDASYVHCRWERQFRVTASDVLAQLKDDNKLFSLTSPPYNPSG
jgi:aspartate/methionine/tyrosine aminotransferase